MCATDLRYLKIEKKIKTLKYRDLRGFSLYKYIRCLVRQRRVNIIMKMLDDDDGG